MSRRCSLRRTSPPATRRSERRWRPRVTAAATSPYEPPSIFELFGTSDEPPEDVIDPAQESRRLQSEGVAAAPIDPADRPVIEEEIVVEEPSPYPEVGLDRRQNNRPFSTVEPAYD